MVSILFHEIGLQPSQWRAVKKRARHVGKTATEYVRSLIERDLLADKSFDEILRPVREEFRKSHTTAKQLDAIVRRARRSKSRTERNGNREAP